MRRRSGDVFGWDIDMGRRLQLTASDFELACQLLPHEIRPVDKAAARRVMVDKLPMRHVADKPNWNARTDADIWNGKGITEWVGSERLSNCVNEIYSQLFGRFGF